MEFSIKVEREEEYEEIYNVVKIAFQTSEHADGDEQDYVNNLRKSENFIPQLALVTKKEQRIIAHIMLTRTFITRQNNEQFEALLLSPICVLIEYRKKGVGSTLIKHSLEKAKKMGFKAVFLVGDPSFYQRFGFKSISSFGLEITEEEAKEYSLALELEEDYLGSKGGTISIC